MNSISFNNLIKEWGKKQFHLRSNLQVFLIILIIVGSNFAIGSYLRENLEHVLWWGDDVGNINIGYNFLKRGTFEGTYITIDDFFGKSVDGLIQQFPTIHHPEGSWGPLYYVVLGSFYGLLKTSPKDLYLHASILSNIISSIFLVLFFILIKKKFSLKIAIFSSAVILSLPFFGWMSTRIFAYGLLFVFSTAALFFLGKRKKDYFLFGVFAGIAHLTHPFGLLMGLSICIFLLAHREFKGLLLSLVGWHIVIIPWMLRNYYFFKDVGWGLYLPFSSQISNLLSFVPNNTVNSISSNYIPIDVITYFYRLPPFQIFTGVFQTDFTGVYHMNLLVLFVFLFTGFAFFKTEKLEFNVKLVILPILGLYYFLVYSSNSIYSEFIFGFILPIILIYFFYKKKKLIFEKPIPRLYSFIIIFSFLTLIGFYIEGLLHLNIPDSKQLMFSIFLLIPLSFLGLEKLVKEIELKLENRVKQDRLVHGNLDKFIKIVAHTKRDRFLKISVLVIILLIISPIIFQLINGTVLINDYFAGQSVIGDFIVEKSEPENSKQVKAVNDWLVNNVPSGTIASNFPQATFLRTGLDSSGIPSLNDQINFEKFLQHYDISYIAIYGLQEFGSQNLYDTIQTWPSEGYSYSKVFSSGSSYVVKTVNLIETSDITKPILYIKKAILLEQNNEPDKAAKIFEEIHALKPTSTKTAQDICDILTDYKKYDLAIEKCNYVLNQDKTNLVALHDIALSYEFSGQSEKVHNVLAQYGDILIQNDDVVNSWADLMNTLIQHNATYGNVIVDLFKKANIIESKGDFDHALKIYDKIGKINQFNTDSLQGKIRILNKEGKTDEIMEFYDSEISSYENELANPAMANKLQVQKSLIDTLYAKAAFATTQNMDSDVEDAYLEIIRMDMFDKNAHEQLAHLYEKEGLTDEAKKEFSFVKRLDAIH